MVVLVDAGGESADDAKYGVLDHRLIGECESDVDSK